MELVSRSCRRILPLVWVVLVSFPPGPTQELLSPHLRVLILASECQGREEAGESHDPLIPYCKSVKGKRKNFYEETRMPDNAADLLSKCCSSVRDTVSVFD